MSSFSHRRHVKGFSSNRIALKVDVVLQDPEIYCLQASPCIFQPGIFLQAGAGKGLRTSLHSDRYLEL